MSEAEKRVTELLDRWLASLELHARYLKLDDAAYATVQAWPKHQRPNKWIIDLAKQRVGELRHHVEERIELGDDEFAEALELMGFLTSLLSSEHLERFVPLALPSKDATVRQAALKPASGAAATSRARPPAAMKPPARAADPRTAADSRRSAAARPVATPTARRAPIPAQKSSAPRAPAPAPRPTPAVPRPRAAPKLSEKLTRLVIDDAVRFLDWGREWPQLAGLIARLADRPTEKEIWDVLSAHRATIAARAKARTD
jgi:hypothetical protein